LNKSKYELEPVIERGDNFNARRDHKLNHVDLVWPCGYFNMYQFYEATTYMYPGLASTFIGKIGHHLCQETDCEALFSMTGYTLEARRLH
jgi:hypothetical protein